MKVKKAISIILLSCLFINAATSSFAGVLSEDKRYETFEDSNITINNVLEEDKINIKVEGNTLVNLWKGFTLVNNTSGWLQGGIQYKNIQGDITVCNYSSKEIYFQLSYNDGTNGENSYYSRSVSVASGQKVKINVLDNEEFRMVQGRYEHGWNNTEEDIEEFNKSLVVLEGDYLNQDISYFEGLQSSFEDQLVTKDMIDNGQEKAENLGKYKVEVKSTGKNLLNTKKNKTIISHGVTITFNDDKTITLNGVATSGFSISLTDENVKYDMSKRYLACVNVISGSCTGYTDNQSWSLLFYTQNGFNPQISTSTNCVQEFTPITKSYRPYLWLGYDSNAQTSSTFDDFTISLQILESGAKDTTYEPYRESINTIYLNSPLLEGDTIEYINGQLYYIKRSGQIVLDGSDDEDWFYYGDGSEDRNGTALFSNRDFKYRLENTSLICNKFKTGYKNVVSNDGFGSVESLWGHNYAIYKDHLYFRINTSKLITLDLNGFKKWLSENPTTVIYKLAEPIYEPIKVDLSIQLFKETTYISNNSNIPATMEITVDRTLNRATEAVELAKTSSTTENISRARMWTNLLKESIIKDQLQGEVNSITEIEDLQLERKTVTSNMDLYVKSENMLSMTLSTNSITFDNYSGADDIEKLNVLEISINSSLPYSLNSYLLSEVQNSDGSSIIDRELFNIRESSQVEYKKFINIGEKLILKDDCEAGNNIVHDIDMKLEGGNTHKADVYKTVIKFEAEQK